MSSNVTELRAEIQQFEKDLDRLDNRLEDTRLMLVQSMLLLRRMNLPPDVERAISIMIRARMVAFQYIRALELLQAASIAGGPLGWLIAITTLGIATVTMTDIAMDLGGR